MNFLLASLSALSVPFVAASPVFAEDLKSFTDGIDTRFSVQYIKSRSGKKDLTGSCIATYKVLDIQQMPDLPIPMVAGDSLELTYPCDKHRKPTNAAGALPWAETKSDGMIEVHIPNKYLKRRALTRAETYWVIDNSNKQFAVVRQPKLVPAYKTER